ncbi:TadE/TadG family type IV pilus assembly protein [Microbacterium sp.]|uniref:TadE/TadG family type IV pilus assembly protein n=1 Tax=Microbacterium sp. TaxID=51671 RepID=UPI0039E66A0A
MIRRGDDAGTATAEFAVVVPAVILVIVLTAGTLVAAGRQVRLEHAVAQAARLAARGEGDDRLVVVVDAIAGGRVEAVTAAGDLVCVEASAAAPPLPALRARSCALAGGR